MIQHVYKHSFATMFRFYDIAANLTDDRFGSYSKELSQNENKHHPNDRVDVVERARAIGCTHLLIATGNIADALHSYKLCNQFQNSYLTIGVHPCRAAQVFYPPFTIQKYFQQLQEALNQVKTKLVAIGECGLDYDRLQYSSKEQQLAVFLPHFDLASKYNLPLYLHNRNTGEDFFQIVKKNRHKFKTGVVHSFTGSKEQVKKIIELDLYIGINGCSLKTSQNLETLEQIPFERILLQTDSPYCEIKKKHAGSNFVKSKFPAKPNFKKGYLIKGRNQPCRIIQVLEVVSQIRKIQPAKLAQIAFLNSMKLFHTL